MKAIFPLILLAITFGLCQASQHVFSIQGTDLYLNNQEFKILGLRCSNALVSEKTTQDLIEHLDLYKSYGINTVSVYFMGSRFGDIKGYRPDASIDPVYASRMARIIEAADERGMIVLVGCIYWSTSRAKEDLDHWTQVESNLAVANTVKWLSENDYRNVFVDPDNEGMAVRSNGWRVESMIAAAHEVDQTIMVANNTHQLARNADLNIHFGPKEANKPWLDAESTPRKEPSGYWGKFSKESHQADSSYLNYSRIGHYTFEQKMNQIELTRDGMENWSGYVFASTWLQCSPAEGIGGPFCDPGGRSELGHAEDQAAAWNSKIDEIHVDAGVLWWLDYVKENYGPWNTIVMAKMEDLRSKGKAFYLERGGELIIEAENYAEHSPSTYDLYTMQHCWLLKTEKRGYSGKGYLQVLPDEWKEGGSGPRSPRDASGAQLIYPIRVNTPGKYSVYVRGMSMGGESNGIHVGIDNDLAGEESGASGMSGFRPHNDWIWEYRRKQEFEQPAELQLNKGDHLLYIWSRDDGFRFDKIVLRMREESLTGTGSGESPTK